MILLFTGRPPIKRPPRCFIGHEYSHMRLRFSIVAYTYSGLRRLCAGRTAPAASLILCLFLGLPRLGLGGIPDSPAAIDMRTDPGRGEEPEEIRKGTRWSARRATRAIRSHISNVQLFDQGKELFFQKKYAEAERILRGTILDHPDWFLAHYYLGRISYEYHKDFVRAIYHLKVAVRNHDVRYRQQALYCLAMSYMGAGQTRLAWETWQEYFKICTPGTEWETKAREYASKVKASLEAPTPLSAGYAPSPSPAVSPH